MLVVPEKQAVVFKLRSPERITSVIPTAKLLHTNTGVYVAVPHRVDETRVLRNLGFAVPAPIRYYYDWPTNGRITPFKAQMEAAAFLSYYRRAFNNSELGTGKSLATLWAYDFLRAQGKLHRAIVVCPMSTMERTWADEVFQHFPHLTTSVLYGTASRRRKLLAQPADIYIINHDGLEIVLSDLKARHDIDLVVVDELAQVGRNASTNRWKALNSVVNDKDFPRTCWGMTGTPTPNGPEDAWAQCRLLVPENVPRYFTRWKDMTMRQYGPYKWVPRPGAMDTVREAMQPAIRFTRDECIDLPPLMYESREVELTPGQQKAYAEMLAQLRTEAENGEILAVNQAVKAAKLVQIACGVAYSTAGTEVVLDAGPRHAAVLDVIHQAEGKVIVYVPFVAALEAVRKAIARAGISVEVIHGGVAKNDRDRIFNAFQKADDPRVLVAQPAAMSHGLTLTKASTIVWYAPINSNEIFEQACGRIQRPGQKMNTFIVMLEGTPIERRTYSRLKNKQDMQGVLLEEISAGNTDVIV